MVSSEPHLAGSAALILVQLGLRCALQNAPKLTGLGVEAFVVADEVLASVSLCMQAMVKPR